MQLESAASAVLHLCCWLTNFTNAGNTLGLGDYRLVETIATTTKPETSIVPEVLKFFLIKFSNLEK